MLHVKSREMAHNQKKTIITMRKPNTLKMVEIQLGYCTRSGIFFKYFESGGGISEKIKKIKKTRNAKSNWELKRSYSRQKQKR